MEPQKRFWVRWNGALIMPNGFDSADPSLSRFLSALTARFSAHPDLTQPTVFSPGDETVMLSAVVVAEHENSAFFKALGAFGACLDGAGAASNLSSEDDESWDSHELTRIHAAPADGEGTYQVKELASVS